MRGPDFRSSSLDVCSTTPGLKQPTQLATWHDLRESAERRRAFHTPVKVSLVTSAKCIKSVIRHRLELHLKKGRPPAGLESMRNPSPSTTDSLYDHLSLLFELFDQPTNDLVSGSCKKVTFIDHEPGLENHVGIFAVISVF